MAQLDWEIRPAEQLIAMKVMRLMLIFYDMKIMCYCFFFLQNIVKENACKIRQQLRNIVDNFSSSFTDETHQLDYEILDNSNWLVINNLYIFILSVDSKFQLQYDFISLK